MGIEQILLPILGGIATGTSAGLEEKRRQRIRHQEIVDADTAQYALKNPGFFETREGQDFGKRYWGKDSLKAIISTARIQSRLEQYYQQQADLGNFNPEPPPADFMPVQPWQDLSLPQVTNPAGINQGGSGALLSSTAGDVDRGRNPLMGVLRAIVPGMGGGPQQQLPMLAQGNGPPSGPQVFQPRAPVGPQVPPQRLAQMQPPPGSNADIIQGAVDRGIDARQGVPSSQGGGVLVPQEPQPVTAPGTLLEGEKPKAIQSAFTPKSRKGTLPAGMTKTVRIGDNTYTLKGPDLPDWEKPLEILLNNAGYAKGDEVPWETYQQAFEIVGQLKANEAGMSQKKKREVDLDIDSSKRFLDNVQEQVKRKTSAEIKETARTNVSDIWSDENTPPQQGQQQPPQTGVQQPYASPDAPIGNFKNTRPEDRGKPMNNRLPGMPEPAPYDRTATGPTGTPQGSGGQGITTPLDVEAQGAAKKTELTERAQPMTAEEQTKETHHKNYVQALQTIEKILGGPNGAKYIGPLTGGETAYWARTQYGDYPVINWLRAPVSEEESLLQQAYAQALASLTFLQKGSAASSKDREDVKAQLPDFGQPNLKNTLAKNRAVLSQAVADYEDFQRGLRRPRAETGGQGNPERRANAPQESLQTTQPPPLVEPGMEAVALQPQGRIIMDPAMFKNNTLPPPPKIPGKPTKAEAQAFVDSFTPEGYKLYLQMRQNNLINDKTKFVPPPAGQ